MKHAKVNSRALRALAATLAAALILLSGAPAASADKLLDYTGKGVGYSSVLYDNSNGLPTSEANAIVQSDDGFIWIGSYSGLIRYDGNEFYRYSSSTGIASVMSLFVDSRQRLWVGTNDTGIALLRDEEFTFYGKAEGLRSASVRSISEDADGNIIIATTKGLAYIDGEDAMHIIDDPRTNNEYVCELFCGNDGVIYGVTLSGAYFTLESLRVGAYYSNESYDFDTVNTVYPDPERAGYVYIGSQNTGELFYGDITKGMADYETFSTAPHATVNAIRLIDGLLWIASDSGIGYFDSNRTFVELLNLPMTNSIDHIMQDYEGNLWFSSSRQGVMKIVGNRFTDISALAKLDPLVVNTTCKHGDDLYVGTDTGLYIIGKDNTLAENSATRLLTGARIRCIRQTSDGRLWLCTYSSNGLVCYDAEADKIINFTDANGLASGRARMMMQLADGSVAVATNGGVNIIKNDEIVETYNAATGLSNLEILCLEEGSDGSLYLGSDGDGIYKISSGGKLTRLGSDDGLHSEVILRMKKDIKEDLFWIITSNSVAYMKDDVITTITEFPYSNNFDLFFDKNDRMWVLSSNGIYVVKRADMLAGGAIEYTHYDAECGLPGIATANSYSHLDPDGTLYVAASTGIFSVNINEETDSGADIRLSVPYITADDTVIWIHGSDTVRIPSDCRRLNIYANAFTYSLNDPHLSYYLEGFDDTPVSLTKQEMSHASYTNLKGGSYVFTLSVINDVTGEIEQTVELTIIKEKAFTETVWFIVLIALLGAALIGGVFWFIYHRKTVAMLHKQAEDKKLINEMTKVFSSCVDMKDAYTNGHSARVAKYSRMFAKAMGKSDEEVEDIYNIALLHDIGKISIPDNILNKPGRLDDDEFAVMKTHATRGYDILKEITIAPDIALGAGYHHEKYNGTGYPQGLKGDEIPEIAQIIAVADAFDAMYSTRPYRKRLPLETVVEEIKRCTGTQFSPKVVDAFLKLVEAGEFNENEEETKENKEE